MIDNRFLRSINIYLDSDHPDRVQHFRPTSKSVRLISSVLNSAAGDALFVIAPYGSGKSITAGYIGHAVENRLGAKETLGVINQRLQVVTPELSEVLQERLDSETGGIFVPLYGHVQSTPKALQEGLISGMKRVGLGRNVRSLAALPHNSSQDMLELLQQGIEKIKLKDKDHLVIIWDEFGRHLQGLISEGRPEELDWIQLLAEFATRQSEVKVSLVLLLHRSLIGYASGLPATLQREWAKIQGRFETLQYVDDSTEMYQLIGSLVTEMRGTIDLDVDFDAIVKKTKEIDLFHDLDEPDLAQVLKSCYPLDPSTLYLLPRVSARVAQNERTLFSFLQWVSLEASVPPSSLYDYFSGEFRADVGPGGTQKAWLETESALQKVLQGSIEEEALKTTFLMGLGLSGERSNSTYMQVLASLEMAHGTESSKVLDSLIDQKLLVHRRHSDQVVVWHGTDVDLRGKLDGVIKQSQSDFELATFLTEEAPPPVWRPIEYNARRNIRRYLESEYVTIDQLKGYLQEDDAGQEKLPIPELEQLSGLPPGSDGRVFYVLPGSLSELEEARKLAGTISNPRVLIAIGLGIDALREAALEVDCLLQMQGDQELLASDPLIRSEIEHFTDDARLALQPLTQRVLVPEPSAGGSEWFHLGELLVVHSPIQLRRKLSEIMEEVFPLTPAINSEMVVRRKPTGVVVNARKKVELGLLERYGQPNLGIQDDFADKAIFKCVLHHTGLYRKENSKVWRLASPKELTEPGLKAVWIVLQKFFTEPGNHKSFTRLIDTLREPPYGVREGLIPILITAGTKGFTTSMALRKKEVFIEDILPSVIEDLMKNPELYSLDVIELQTRQTGYLRGIVEIFESKQVGYHQASGDLLRASIDTVLEWHADLPSATSESSYLSSEARTFERELRSLDPVRLFFVSLPKLVDIPLSHSRKLLVAVEGLKKELESIQTLFEQQALEALEATMVSRGVCKSGTVRELAASWANFFPKSFTKQLPSAVTRSVLGRLQAPYKKDGALVNALSTLLIGLPIREWNDSHVSDFRRELRNTVETIESTALAMSDSMELDPSLKAALISLAETKAEAAALALAKVIGEDQAADRIEKLAEKIRLEKSKVRR